MSCEKTINAGVGGYWDRRQSRRETAGKENKCRCGKLIERSRMIDLLESGAVGGVQSKSVTVEMLKSEVECGSPG